jgi:hypothetical protein
MAVKKMFRRIGNPKDLDVKLAPQERVVFDAIPRTKTGIEREELIAKLEELAKTPDPKNEGKMVLQTGQKPASILGYYTKHLVDSKLIEVERIEEKPVKTTDQDQKAA